MSIRSKKLANLIKIEISNLLLMGEIKDPRIQNTIITDVNVSNDIAKATIFFSYSNNDNFTINEVLSGFNKASGFIRNKLAKNLYLKKMPKLFFVYDKKEDEVCNIEKILRQIKNE